MATRRGTNNSTILNLDQQTAVIAQMSALSGLEAERDSSAQNSSEKVVKKKKAKVKVSEKTLDPQARKTKTASGSRAVGEVTSQPVQAPTTLAAPSNQPSNGAQAVPAAGSRSNQPGNVTQLEDGPRESRSGGQGDGLEPDQDGGQSETRDEDEVREEDPDEGELFLRQQQWLWQQQWQQLAAMNPIPQPQANQGPSRFGNYVPNFQFGFLPPQAHFWGQEAEPEEPNEAAPGARPRQAVHEISEDEEEEEPGAEAPAVVAQAPATAANLSKTERKVRDQLTTVKDSDRVADKADPEVANLLDRYLKEATVVAEMEKLTKVYPKIANVESMRVPRLDNKIFQAVDQNIRNVDQSFQGIQRALLGAMTAITPVLNLVFQRKASDPELDMIGENVTDGLKLIAHVSNALSGKRRDLIKLNIAPIYARTLTKSQEESSEWLFGGDLVEVTKQCEVSKRIGEKVMKRKTVPQLRGKPQQFKRFKAPFPATFAPTFRAFNPFQMNQVRFPVPQGFAQGFPQQQQQQFFPPGGFMPFPRRFRNPKPRQGFAKRGAYNK